MKQTCDVCGAVRYWGVVPEPPCPERATSGEKCSGRLRFDPKIDELIYAPEPSVTEDVEEAEVLIAQSKIVSGEQITLARRVKGVEAEAILDEAAEQRQADLVHEAHAAGIEAGRRQVLERVAAVAEAHARIAKICGQSAGADLLQHLADAIRDEFAP